MTPEEQAKLITQHLNAARRQIEADATAAGEELDIPQLGRILEKYARTAPIPPSTKPTLWGQILNVPGILWISAALAVTFGLLSRETPALSDIAKVFAGAIVGAAGAGGIAPAGSRPRA